VSRDNKKTGDFRQIGDQIFRQPVDKVVLFAIAAHVAERQNGDRRVRIDPFAYVSFGIEHVEGLKLHKPARTFDVLQRLFAQIVKHDI